VRKEGPGAAGGVEVGADAAGAGGSRLGLAAQVDGVEFGAYFEMILISTRRLADCWAGMSSSG